MTIIQDHTEYPPGAMNRMNERFVVSYSIIEALTLMGQGLLALKHPENTGISAKVARDLLVRLIEAGDLLSVIPQEVAEEWAEELGMQGRLILMGDGSGLLIVPAVAQEVEE